MMNIKFYLIFTLLLLIHPSFAQKSKKDDTLSNKHLYSKLLLLESLIRNNTNTDTKLNKTKSDENEIKLKEHEKKIKSLSDTINILNAKIKKLKEDNTLYEKNKETQELNNLQNEINALLSQEYTFPLELLISIENRSNKLKFKPNNIDKLIIYKDAYSKINKAYKLLEIEYNIEKNNESIMELNKLKLDEKVFYGLFQNKDKILKLLNLYCDKTNELANYIIDFSDAPEEKLRKERLSDKEYIIKFYPYLKQQFNKALDDKDFRIKKSECKKI